MRNRNQDKKVVAIIQARMGSSRLPKKTMAEICGKPLIQRILDRLEYCNTINELIIATTTDVADKVILEYAKQNGFLAFAGSVDDVLDRFYQSAKEINADIIVRITADDPFKDPKVIDMIVNQLLSNPILDYVSNTIEPTFPEGIDVEVFTFQSLEIAWQESNLPSEREHVTPFIWNRPNRFNLLNVRNNEDLSHLRWTIDYEDDLRFAREIYLRLGSDQIFFMQDILALLREEPELLDINQRFERNLGYKKSLEQEGHDRKGVLSDEQKTD